MKMKQGLFVFADLGNSMAQIELYFLASHLKQGWERACHPNLWDFISLNYLSLGFAVQV